MTDGQPNRRRLKRPKSESTVDLIDRLLLEKIEVTIDGTPTQVTVLAAIVFKLLHAELGGDAMAGRVLLKYQQITKRVIDRQIHLMFAVANDARSLGSVPGE